MASIQTNSQVTTDSINMSEKKEVNVSVEPVPSPLASKTPTEEVVPKNWPDQPEHLAVSWLYEFGMLMYDLFLCILTLALVAKTTLCIVSFKINSERWAKVLGYPVDTGSTLTNVLQILNSQIVTAFTIVFVTIMTTVTRRYALWKAQRGAYVSDLEQMCGSVSLPSTIKMVFVLRKFTLSSLLLVALWSFYYLGSQASAREYVHDLSGPHHLAQGAFPGDAVIFDFTQPQNFQDESDDISFINDEFRVNGLLDLGTGIDINGFLLVPDMRLKNFADDGSVLDLPEQRSEGQLQQWMSVEPGELSGTSYTAYVGRRAYVQTSELQGAASKAPSWGYIGTMIGHEGVSVVGSYIFTTSFVSVQCNTAQSLSLENMPLGVTETAKTSFNLSSPSTLTSNSSDSVNFNIWHKWDQDEICQDDPDLCAESSPLIEGMDSGVLKISCTITRPHVQIVATCPTGACLARMIRYLPTSASNPFTNTTWSSAFFEHILGSTGSAYEGLRNDTRLQFNLGTYDLSRIMYANGTGEDSIAQKLLKYGALITQSFNTYINIADQAISGSPVTSDDTTNYPGFTMYGALYFPQYRLIWSWIALDYVSTAILFIASIASIWLRKNTLAPDIFGYVSSLTRDNPHVPVTEGGSSLSGIDRARAMKRVKIKIADIGTEDGVGKIGVVHVHENANVQSLSKHRKYI